MKDHFKNKHLYIHSVIYMLYRARINMRKKHHKSGGVSLYNTSMYMQLKFRIVQKYEFYFVFHTSLNMFGVKI